MSKPNKPFHKEPKEFEEKVIEIKRLSKKTSGGNKISFSALVVIGDKKGRVGIGLDKAADVMSAIQKAIKAAKKKVVTINLIEGTIPHEINYSKSSSHIIMKPAPRGTGVIAGGSVRAVLEAVGVENIVTKSLGSKNKTLNVKCALEALLSMKPALAKTKKQVVDQIKKANPEVVAPARVSKPVSKPAVKSVTKKSIKTK